MFCLNFNKSKLIVLLFVLLCSCTAQKDHRAVNRVKANIDLLNDCFYEGLKLHPCDNDTLYLPPKIDRKGTIRIDSLRPVYNGITGNMGYSIVKITEIFRDSFPYKVIDNQKVNILTDSLNSKEKSISFLKGQNTEIVKQKEEYRKEVNKKGWTIALLIAIALASNGLWIYFKFKKVKI